MKTLKIPSPVARLSSAYLALRQLLYWVQEMPVNVATSISDGFRRLISRLRNHFFAPTYASVYQARWTYDRRMRQLAPFIIDRDSDII